MTNDKSEDISNDEKIFAFISILLGVIGFIIALLARKESKYVMYYARQSITLIALSTLISFASIPINTMPVIGYYISAILLIGYLLIWIIALVNSLSGKMKATPIISKFAEKIKI